MKTKFSPMALALLIPLCCQAQSNVYSIAIYSAGTSYRELCSLDLPASPHQYKLTERSWYEDARGLTIIDAHHRKTAGDILRRCLEVECGAETFVIPLGDLPARRVKNVATTKESGDLVSTLTQCATNRGCDSTTNTLPTIQMSWIRHSRKSQDVIVLEGDHFTEIGKVFELAYGPADERIRSSTHVGNGRSHTYFPKSTSVILNLTSSSSNTIISVIETRKP